MKSIEFYHFIFSFVCTPVYDGTDFIFMFIWISWGRLPWRDRKISYLASCIWCAISWLFDTTRCICRRCCQGLLGGGGGKSSFYWITVSSALRISARVYLHWPSSLGFFNSVVRFLAEIFGNGQWNVPSVGLMAISNLNQTMFQRDLGFSFLSEHLPLSHIESEGMGWLWWNTLSRSFDVPLCCDLDKEVVKVIGG